MKDKDEEPLTVDDFLDFASRMEPVPPHYYSDLLFGERRNNRLPLREVLNRKEDKYEQDH